MVLQGVHQRSTGTLQEDRRLALPEPRLERFAMFAQPVLLHLAEKRMPAGRAMRCDDQVKTPGAERTKMPVASLLHHPSALDADAREDHVEPVAPELDIIHGECPFPD